MTALSLDACGETLSNAEFMRVLGVKASKFYELKQHGLLPDPVPGTSSRYSKAVVRAWLEMPRVVARKRSA